MTDVSNVAINIEGNSNDTIFFLNSASASIISKELEAPTMLNITDIIIMQNMRWDFHI